MAPTRGKNSSIRKDVNASSSSNEESLETYIHSVTRKSLTFSNTPKTGFKYISLAGESDSGAESVDENINYSGVVNRPPSRHPVASTPMHNANLNFPRVSFSIGRSSPPGKHGKPKRISIAPSKGKSLQKSKKKDKVSHKRTSKPLQTLTSANNHGNPTSPVKSPQKSRSPSKNVAQKERSPVKSPQKSRPPSKNVAQKEKSPIKSPPKKDQSPEEGHQQKTKEIQTPARRESIGQTSRSASGSTNRRKSLGQKPRRHDAKILKNIRDLQKSTNLLIRRMPFVRLVKEIADGTGVQGLRWQGAALMALQEATEMAMVTLFESANLCCLHSGRVTLKPKDLELAVLLTGFLK